MEDRMRSRPPLIDRSLKVTEIFSLSKVLPDHIRNHMPVFSLIRSITLSRGASSILAVKVWPLNRRSMSPSCAGLAVVSAHRHTTVARRTRRAFRNLNLKVTVIKYPLSQTSSAVNSLSLFQLRQFCKAGMQYQADLASKYGEPNCPQYQLLTHRELR